MSPQLPVVTSSELERVAKKVGFILDRQKGSHAVYFRTVDKRRVVIHRHAGKNLKPKTLAAIIQDMGLTVDELKDLL